MSVVLAIFWSIFIVSVAWFFWWFFRPTIWVILRRHRLRKERVLFLTHSFGPWCAVGTVHDGYVVTKVRRLANTSLCNGGSVLCWEVKGRLKR